MNTSEKIADSAPINRVAARVMRKGTHFEKKQGIGSERLEAPLPIQPVPDRCENLTGQRFGDLTVIGYLGRKRDRAQWQARCACGYYVRRSGTALRRPGNHLQCSDCEYREYIRLRYQFNQTGVWPLGRFEVKAEKSVLLE